MKNQKLQKARSLLRQGTRALALTSLLLVLVSCSHGGKKDTDKSSSKCEVTTTCTTSTTTSTSITSTTLSTTTSTDTTTMVTRTITTETQTIVQENIPAIESQPVYVEPDTEYIATPLSIQSEPVQSDNTLPITDYERTLLRNVVAREYGSDWVAVSEKAKVVAVVMNRVNDPRYPNTIEGVLTQPYQFSGYYACGYEWSNVTDSVREAVDYYFAHPEEFGSWTGFWGDGYSNHFY